MSRPTHLIFEFLSSNKDYILINWSVLGYASLQSAAYTIMRTCDRKQYGCHGLVHNGDLYLVRDGFELPKNPKKQTNKFYDTGKGYTFLLSHWLKDLLDIFMESDLQIIELPWEDLGYIDDKTCYCSIRNAIIRYNLNEKIVITVTKHRAFLFKIPKEGSFEQLKKVKKS